MSRKREYRQRAVWVTVRNLSILFILLGLTGIACSFTPVKPSYSDLLKADITILSIKEHPASRYISSAYTIKSNNNEVYSVTGEYNANQLNMYLTQNKIVHIKYYVSSFLKRKNIVELTCDGTKLVVYYRNTTLVQIGIVIVSLLFISVGIIFIVLGKRYYRVKHK